MQPLAGAVATSLAYGPGSWGWRGILLGEQVGGRQPRDWHLKGAGLTPDSRMGMAGDGRAVLRGRCIIWD